MKITQRGPADTNLSQLVQNDKQVTPVRRDSSSEVRHSSESSKVNISKEARELQRVAELARAGDELRAQKVQQIKDQIAKGTYNADPHEISKSIVRSEVSNILQNK